MASRFAMYKPNNFIAWFFYVEEVASSFFPNGSTLESCLDFLALTFTDLVSNILQKCFNTGANEEVHYITEADSVVNTSSSSEILLSVLDILCQCSSRIMFLQFLQTKPSLMNSITGIFRAT